MASTQHGFKDESGFSVNKKVWQETGRYVFFVFFLFALGAIVFLIREAISKKGIF